MAFANDLGDPFQQFAEKYGLVPGFQGDYDLRAVFGDLVDDQSFVIDRVGVFILIFHMIVDLYSSKDVYDPNFS